MPMKKCSRAFSLFYNLIRFSLVAAAGLLLIYTVFILFENSISYVKMFPERGQKVNQNSPLHFALHFVFENFDSKLSCLSILCSFFRMFVHKRVIDVFGDWTKWIWTLKEILFCFDCTCFNWVFLDEGFYQGLLT